MAAADGHHEPRADDRAAGDAERAEDVEREPAERMRSGDDASREGEGPTPPDGARLTQGAADADTNPVPAPHP
jgi:hypothetical protein